MRTLFCLLAAIILSSGISAQDQPKKPEAPAAAKKFQNIDAATFDKMRRADTNTVVLDVRTKEEYDAGHIAGAVLIDFNSPDFEREAAKLDKSKTYLVHCAAGGRSARACRKMEGLKFPRLFNLEGGMGAWEKAGKPVEK